MCWQKCCDIVGVLVVDASSSPFDVSAIGAHVNHGCVRATEEGEKDKTVEAEELSSVAKAKEAKKMNRCCFVLSVE